MTQIIKFGLVTEGHTDQAMIKNILTGYFQGSEYEVRFRPLPSDIDLSDESEINPDFGGWKQVLDYCASEDFIKVFENSPDPLDYVVIQIDTDRSEDTHFDVAQTDETGQKISPELLVEKVIEKGRKSDLLPF